jgi:phosphonate transport system permease protein
MTIAIQQLPDRQLAPLMSAYRRAVFARRLRIFAGCAVLLISVILAAWWVGFDLALLVAKIDTFTNYFGRIFTLDDGKPVLADPLEWYWGFFKWSKLLGETLLVAYTGTILGAVIGFFICFAAASNLVGPKTRWVARRFLEFCRTVPGIVFALIFVLAFGLGPMAGVLALVIHTLGALGKLYTEIVENIDMKPVEGIVSTGGSRAETIFYGVLPQVWSGFATYTLLRFEINFREASVMGFVGAGGIGMELLTAVRKFYYSDVSALLVMIIVTVFVLDILTGLVLKRLNRMG